MAQIIQSGVNTPHQNARWFGRRELIATVLGALLYCAITWFTSFAKLGGSLDIELRPAIVIPIIFGFMYGPVAGFLVGTLGNLLGDYLLWDGVWWQWSVGNGIMGLVPGLYALRWRSYFSLKEQLIAFLVSLVGIVLGMGFAAYSTIFICQEASAGSWLAQIQAGQILANCSKIPITASDSWAAFQPAVKVNAVNTLILQPILLFNIARLDLRSINWLGSGLLRRLLLAVIVSAALPIALLGFFLSQQFSGQEGDTESVLPKLIATIVLTLLFTVANASLVAQTLTSNLLRLTGAARNMENGELKDEQINELMKENNQDEIGNLSRVFGRMAREVIEREKVLRKQVEQLRIEIDLVKKSKQVEEVISSDFFQELKVKSQAIRARQQKSMQQKKDQNKE
ncbi:MAG: ECF transporter S component [Anaerolineales bacterium]|nr:ECF transporter S component [Anaerolineales bacterium]